MKSQLEDLFIFNHEADIYLTVQEHCCVHRFSNFEEFSVPKKVNRFQLLDETEHELLVHLVFQSKVAKGSDAIFHSEHHFVLLKEALK